MKKISKFLLKLLPLSLVSALPILSLAGCSSGGSSPPEFVGTWKGITAYGTSTITFTETTIASLMDSGAGNTYSATGTITSYDTAAKHILAVAATTSYTGSPPTTPTIPGDKLYFLYSLSGTTLTIASSKTGYPADLTSGMALTKQ